MRTTPETTRPALAGLRGAPTAVRATDHASHGREGKPIVRWTMLRAAWHWLNVRMRDWCRGFTDRDVWTVTRKLTAARTGECVPVTQAEFLALLAIRRESRLEDAYIRVKVSADDAPAVPYSTTKQ